MLPGFRFLFAAIMLSLSLLIFGLGAAALFRAAHESFASNSSWRATPDVPFAQRPETTLPMLATLRVEPMTIARAPDTAKLAAAPAEPTSAISEPMTSDQVAALRPAEAPVTEIAKPAETPAPAPVAENPPAPEATPPEPAAADVTTSSEIKTAAVTASDAVPVKEPATAQPEPVADAAPAAPAPAKAAPVAATEAPTPATEAQVATTETSDAMTKIATLGGPPVEITDTESVLEARMVKLPRARPDESVIKKRQQARRALRRRRLAAARARLLAQQQLQANPFAQQAYAQPQQTFATTAPR